MSSEAWTAGAGAGGRGHGGEWGRRDSRDQAGMTWWPLKDYCLIRTTVGEIPEGFKSGGR